MKKHYKALHECNTASSIVMREYRSKPYRWDFKGIRNRKKERIKKAGLFNPRERQNWLI